MTLVYPRANLYSSRPSIWYVTQYPLGNFFILHLMTLEHSRAKLYSSRPFIWYVTWFHLGIFFILHLMTPDHPRAEFYSSRPSIWYVTQYPSCNILILHSMTLEHSLGLNSTLRDLSFDMSHNTLWVTFSFCTWWPWYTPGLNLVYSSRPSIWYVTQYPSGNFLILHSMTLEHPRAKLYSSRPFISYVTWYP
jgi:hypothetical protein